jgi:hypothetical protein
MMFQLDMVCDNLIIQVHKSPFYARVFTVIFVAELRLVRMMFKVK